MDANKPLFRDLTADDPDPEITVIESMCMHCHGNGETKLLLTKIPFYKEVVVMSFTCNDCGYQNNELQSGSIIPEKGIKITFTVRNKHDLCRQLVKSDHTSIKIPELDFEIPGQTQKGEVTTVEGVINRCITGLSQDQEARKEQHPEAAEQIDIFIKKLEDLKEVEKPFTLILEDVSGNSFIENPNAPKLDPFCVNEYFERTKEQNHALNIFTEEEVTGDKPIEPSILHPIKEGEFTLEDIEGEVLQFPTNCFNCGSPCQTNMKMTNIPHFKSVIIMATTCEVCGYNTNEVKSGAGIEPKGVLIEVKVKNKLDLTRDVLKSETCHLEIPELELQVGPHALGGRFTTVEGLLLAIKDHLNDPSHSHIFGDSEEKKTKEQFEAFLKKFDDIIGNKLSVTLILDDPCGNSYIQSMEDGDEADDQLKITHYQRTFEQNEELGLNDMKTENYEES
ncbi:hypothetical protein GWI33_019941 [Rhynchophorus ferrugineus]|uniref:Zinc finger ZPR1-type domain-containing protein n=1 Tax=Rhynchophorus ferrugineus TaxID=354439 RepID=A0A834HQE7_RHYFE|nr:hypothetical protein GWI33_019941 [Rhynchophorus ferrugineus]